MLAAAKGQPLTEATTANGRDKTICVRELKPHQVAEKMDIVLDSSGRKMSPINRQYPVESSNPSVRGIYSPLHQRHMI